MKYLKLFDQHTEYETYINGSDKIFPNVSYCENENELHYNPYVEETRMVATFNVTSTTEATKICNSTSTSNFTEIEIDGVVQPSVVSTYTFDTTGEHTVKYTLADPTRIADSVFFDCTGLTNVIIPNTVTRINSNAFYNCYGLTSIDIPCGVTIIGAYAFQNCSGLTSITISDSVTTIGAYAFAECTGLTSVTIPNSVTTIYNQAFYYCSSLTSITSLATTAPTIFNYTFRGVKTGGTLTVLSGSTGYNVWMGTGNYYLGKYNWTKVEQ